LKAAKSTAGTVGPAQKLIEERKPASIAIDVSPHAFSDGLSSGEREKLESTLGSNTSNE
jgi:hypothetical protein